ncbi:MAG: hypothetical protein AB7T49_03800 [Oligoflexales bacterium]
MSIISDLHKKTAATNVFVAALLLAQATYAQGKTIGSYPSTDGKYTLTLETVPEKDSDPGIVLNRVTSLFIVLSNANPREKVPPIDGLKFDARMPEHDHGLVTTPVVKQTRNKSFRIEGVKFHMAGNWDINLEVITAKPIHFRIPLKI